MQSIIKEIILTNIIDNANKNYPDYDLDCCKCLLKTDIKCRNSRERTEDQLCQRDSILFIKNYTHETLLSNWYKNTYYPIKGLRRRILEYTNYKERKKEILKIMKYKAIDCCFMIYE